MNANSLNIVNFLVTIERNTLESIKMYYFINNVLCKIFQISKEIDLGFKFLGHICKHPLFINPSPISPLVTTSILFSPFLTFLGCDKRNFTLEQK